MQVLETANNLRHFFVFLATVWVGFALSIVIIKVFTVLKLHDGTLWGTTSEAGMHFDTALHCLLAQAWGWLNNTSCAPCVHVIICMHAL